MLDAKSDKPDSRKVTRDAHWMEWATGVVCATLVAAMTLWIAYHAATQTGGAPELGIRNIRQHPVADGYAVSFTIENRGARSAAAVAVTGEVTDSDTVIETREVTFDYVPAQSSVSGALLFKTDPSAHALDIRASGYVDP